MRAYLAIILLLVCVAPLAAQTGAAVVINEFIYDDYSTDDFEFVELYNATAQPVDISGWTLEAADPTTTNTAFTIPAGTILPAGGFYVIGAPTVPNVDLVVAASNNWENSQEDLALVDATGKLIDSVAYECRRGYWTGSREEGEGIWGDGYGYQPADTFFAIMLGRSVVPAVTSTGYGRARVQFDTTSGQVTIHCQVAGLTPTSVGLYDGAAGTPGTLIFNLTQGTTAWTGTGTLTPAQMTNLQAGDTYIGVNTAAQPAGELRGQVVALPVSSCSRRQDGLDTGNNGVDFGLRLSTPGMTNKPFGIIGPVLAEPFDSLTVDTPVADWSYTYDAPRAIDPTTVGTYNLNTIPASPGGGNAMVVWDPNGASNLAVLHMDGLAGDVVLDCHVYIDSAVLSGSDLVSWTLGIGGSCNHWYDAPDPSGTLGYTSNGNTGLGWTYQNSATGPVLYLIDHHDGGWGSGAKTQPVILGQVAIQAGINDGWQRLRLERVGNKVRGVFGGTVNGGGGTCFSGTSPAVHHDYSVYVGFRHTLAATAVRPFTADTLFIRPGTGAVTLFGQGGATTAGVPTIDTNGPATVGNSCFRVEAGNLVTGTGAAMLLGFSQFPTPVNLVPIGGSTGSMLYVNPLMGFNLVKTGGTAGLPLPIPLDTNLVGGKLFLQVVDMDPALPLPALIGISPGLEVTLGSI